MDPWKVVAYTDIPPEAKYESVLFVKSRAEDIEGAGDEQEYWGPFYIDIDVKDDLLTAFGDTREIVNFLKTSFNLDDTALRIYASGGKGFHIEVNPYLYMDTRFRKALPFRYSVLASRLKQDIGNHLNIDLGVYSSGKGRQWRRTNVQRENGNYKVWLPDFELLTIDEILDRTKRPGPMPPYEFDKVPVNPLMVSWFNSTKKLADLSKVTAPVPEKTIIKNEIPECVSKLANNEDIKFRVNSNLLAMQAISYGIARGWDISKIIDYNRIFISEYRSTQYKTPLAFENHFKALYNYAINKPERFGFGCKMMLSCVNNVNCDTCKIKVGDNKDVYKGVRLENGGYILDKGDDNKTELTNFSIKWLKEVVKEDGTTLCEFLIKTAGDSTSDLVVADDHVFDSKNNFNLLLNMYRVYLGSEKDLAMLKLAVAHLSKPKRLREVGYTGLVWSENKWHYVNLRGSYALDGTIDKIKTSTEASMAINTELNFTAEDVPEAHDIIQTIATMIELNDPEIIIPMIGWFFNAYFNPHAQFAHETSPSLFVTGLHGSGKTQTMLQLHRLFAPKTPAFPSISTTTAFSMNRYASATNLMPLIFDEFKPSSNAGKNNEEGQVSQAIRASYNKAFESRGTVTRQIDQTPFYAPLAIIGEQQLNEGAIADRIILIQMDKQSHSQKNTEALETVKTLPIEKIGAAFLEFAMDISPKEYMEAVIRKENELQADYTDIFDSRPRRNIANLLVAINYLEYFILINTGDEKLVNKIMDKVALYKATFKSSLHKISNEMRSIDDITLAVNTLNDLADMGDATLGDSLLLPNRHYTVDKDKNILYLDIFACYRLLRMYIKRFELDIYLTDKASFLAQLNHKEFVVKKVFKSDIIASKTRAVVGISMDPKYKLQLDNFK